MNPLVSDILAELAIMAPPPLAEKWDNVGLLVGRHDTVVKKILVALDSTHTLLDEAISTGADTIITHHPIIFKPLPFLQTDTPEGGLLQKALSNNVNIIACHTNLDAAHDGINDVLAQRLGLTALEPLEFSNSAETTTGLGRIGHFAPSLSWQELQQRLHDTLKLTHFNVAGPMPKEISTMAILGGSGSDFARLAQKRGADVYLTSEVKHDIAIWAHEAKFCIIDGTHFSTERPGIEQLCNTLQQIAQARGWQTTISMTETERHPFVTVLTHRDDYALFNQHRGEES